MSKKPTPEGALFVRLPATAVEKLDRAAEALGVRKKDLVAGLVSRYVDPDTRRGLHELSVVASQRSSAEPADPAPKGRSTMGANMGSYSFQPYDPPEVMNAEQAGEFLQVDPAVVIDMAEVGKLPGRKLGVAWRFSRAALVAWLSTPDKR